MGLPRIEICIQLGCVFGLRIMIVPHDAGPSRPSTNLLLSAATQAWTLLGPLDPTPASSCPNSTLVPTISPRDPVHKICRDAPRCNRKMGMTRGGHQGLAMRLVMSPEGLSREASGDLSCGHRG